MINQHKKGGEYMRNVIIGSTIVFMFMIFGFSAKAQGPLKEGAMRNFLDPQYMKEIQKSDATKRATKIEKVKFDSQGNVIGGNVSAMAIGDGVNNISFSSFTAGDMVVGRGSTCDYFAGIYPCYWKHLALYDSDYNTGSEYDKALWSAYPNSSVETDVNGKVGRQTKWSIHNYYDQAQGIWAASTTYQERYNTTWYAYGQRGEPYDALSSKSNTSSWYCSKIAWKAYLEKTLLDFDSNGGYHVIPDDIYLSKWVRIFATAS